MTKYKLDKQVQERLDVVNELNIKIEEMSPVEARQIPWTAGEEDEIPDVGCVVEIGADGPFGQCITIYLKMLLMTMNFDSLFSWRWMGCWIKKWSRYIMQAFG